MDRLFRALSLSQNKDSKEKKISKSLDDWKLPPCSPSDVFKRKGIFNFSPDYNVKTVEKEIPLSEGYSSFPLFTENLQRLYRYNYFLLIHIGMIQVGLKPTKLGSNTSAIICLRDKARSEFYQSLFGMVESSLSDGPVYFSYFPTDFLNIRDPDLSSRFTVDVNITQGSSTMPGDGNMILMYRCHYKLMDTTSPDRVKSRRGSVGGDGETTLFVTNVARSNRVVSKRVFWDQIPVPERWMDENNSVSAVENGAPMRSG